MEKEKKERETERVDSKINKCRGEVKNWKKINKVKGEKMREREREREK